MNEILNAIILGIIQGITEFLPISSTGHLVVASDILQLQDDLQGLFEIFIQIGSVVALLALNYSEIWQQIRTVTTETRTRNFWFAIIIAFIPAAIMGVLFDDFISSVLFSPTVIAISLILGGILFIIVERRNDAKDISKADSEQSIYDVTFRQAIFIGFWQMLALVPGTSRSGMTILGGMFNGLNRSVATQFSFYLAMPTLGGATIYTLVRNLDSLSADSALILAIGTIVSAIVSWVAIRWLLRYVATNNFIPFGYYRIILGIIILILVSQNTLL